MSDRPPDTKKTPPLQTQTDILLRHDARYNNNKRTQIRVVDDDVQQERDKTRTQESVTHVDAEQRRNQVAVSGNISSMTTRVPNYCCTVLRVAPPAAYLRVALPACFSPESSHALKSPRDPALYA